MTRARFVHWLSLVTALLLTLLTRPLFAATDVRAELEADTLSLGDTVQLVITASSDQSGGASEVDPGVPGSLRVVGQSQSPSHTISIINGVRSEKNVLRATYVLSPSKLGTYTIRPIVAFGGTRVRAKPVTLKVVAAGRAPKPKGRTLGGPAIDPFGAFTGILEDFDADDFLQGRQGKLSDPSLAMVPAPRGKLAFLHARADKTSGVVGEQVTYSVYLFVDAEQAEPRIDDVHEANAKEFLRLSVEPEDKLPKTLGHTTIGGHLWTVKLLRKYALFPVSAGRLQIAPMSLRVQTGRSVFQNRESERITVDVSEPPAQGRPAGYVLGDVGKMKLSANVTPREVEAGGAVTVEVLLEGTGNLPQSITPPPRKGLEWLPPETRSNIVPDADGRIGGTRTFTYVLRARDPGTIDLGELTLPFFDPQTGKYDVARAPLGTLVVKGSATKADDRPRNVLEGLPKPFTTQQPPAQKSVSFIEGRSFWALFLAAPGLALIYVLGHTFLRRFRAQSETRRESPKAVIKSASHAVEEAMSKGDARAVDAALRRYIETVVEQKLGVSRSIELDRLARAMTDAGAEPAVADELVRIMREAESARFAPGGASLQDAKNRFDAAKRALERLPAPKGAGKTAAVAATIALFVTFGATEAHAQESFANAARALTDGKPEIAIAELEVLADRGVVDAHASFDRGLAYAERVRLGGGQTGDLGRAVHGFEEAKRLSSDPDLVREADRALHLIRAEIARQRARGEAVELESRSLDETIASAFSASGWGVLACVMSLVASLAGLAAYLLRSRAESVGRRLRAGAWLVLTIAAPIAIAAAIFGRERAHDRARSWAVVIAPEARALGAARTNAIPMPEGAIVEVTKTEAGRVEVRWGTDREWLSRAGVRLLVARR